MADQNSGDNIKIENIRDSTIIVKSTVGTEPKEIPIPWMAPEPPDDFVPRPYEFEQLRGYLLGATEQEPVAITTALRGAGGYGKTTLAAALCHDQRVRDAFPQGILWITLGEKPTNLPGLVEDVVYALTGERPGFVDVNAAAATLAQAWGERRCLLVVDDVWNEAHLRPFLRGGKSCTRLITTRNRETLPPAVQMVDVDAMRQAEAVALLSANLPTSETAPLTWPLQKLAQRLGEWPTLLKLINRVLQRRSQQQPLAQAVAYVNEALDRRGLTAFDQRNAAERHQAVAQTIGVSLELLTADERQRLAELAIFPEDVEIPLTVVQKLWQATGGLDAFDSQELCQQLYDLSLLLAYQSQSFQSIRLHDILPSYVLAHAGINTANVHKSLLQHYSFTSIQQDLLSEPYMQRFIAYHLYEAGETEVLRWLLLNFEWIYFKLKSKSFAELLESYNYFPRDPDLQIVKQTLYMAGPYLIRHKEQLLGQLYGRLLDHPSPVIQAMLAESSKTQHQFSSLIPVTATLPPPNNLLLLTLSGHSLPVTAVAITPDGQRIVSASVDRTLKIWSLASGQEEMTLSGHLWSVNDVAITPDNAQIISVSDDNTLRIWNLISGQAELTLAAHSQHINSVAITPNGRYFISASQDSTLKLWDISSQQAKYTFNGHSRAVNDVAITPNGQFAVSASADKMLKVWNLFSGQLEYTFAGHTGSVNAVAITSDGEYVISASSDHTLKLWCLATGQVEQTLSGHSGSINAVTFSADGKQVISASSDRTLKIWNLSSGQVERSIFENPNSFWVSSVASKLHQAIAITLDNKYLISASGNDLRIWNLQANAPFGQIERSFVPARGRVNAIAIIPNNQLVVLASTKQSIKFWSPISGQTKHSFSIHTDSINSIVITPNGQRAISASSDKTLKIWSITSGQVERILIGHSKCVNSVAIIPNSQYAVSASDDETIKMWHLDSGQVEHTLLGHSQSVRSVAVTPDGQFVISASADHTLKLWDIATKCAIHTFYGHSSWVNTVIITDDGQHVLSASVDQTVKVWSLTSWNLAYTFSSHEAGVTAIATTKDSQWAISASEDKTVKIWHLQTGAINAEIDLEVQLSCIAIMPDGQTIVAGDYNGMVHFLRWQRPIPLAKTVG